MTPFDDGTRTAPILIVDDHRENVTLLKRILGRAGYSMVVGTTDARRAEDEVRRIAPRLVLLDLHMPYLDGYQVLDRIRPLMPDAAQVILVTGEVDEGTRVEAIRRGAVDVVIKPFDVHAVLACVERELRAQWPDG